MTDAEVEAVARAIADANGDNWDAIFRDKRHWIEHGGVGPGGRFRDVNEPRHDDYLEMARAAIAAMPGREWMTIESAPTKQFTKALIYDGSAAYVGQLVNGRWLLSWNHEDPNPDDVDRPTHWQPLPDPPKG